MPSPFAAACWPTRFVARWFAVFFGAALLGVLLGAATYKRAPKLVQIHLKAIEIYTDGTQALVPAEVWTGGNGDQPIKDSYQNKLSISTADLTPISREAGSKLWLIFRWQNTEQPILISPWPKTTVDRTVDFRLNRPNPRRPKH